MKDHQAETEGLVVALITAPEENAAPIARTLVERHLAACVNVVDGVRSVYRWQGEIEAASEALLVVKTRADAIPSITALLTDIHPHETFELIALPITDGNPSYLDWLALSV